MSLRNNCPTCGPNHFFLKKYASLFSTWKKQLHVSYFCNYKNSPKQSPNGLKIAQSCHPARSGCTEMKIDCFRSVFAQSQTKPIIRILFQVGVSVSYWRVRRFNADSQDVDLKMATPTFCIGLTLS
jgi:hypothetical protein